MPPCVVPYTRGPSIPDLPVKFWWSKIPCKNGTKEIILLGQNVNAYNHNGLKLSDLVLELEEIKELKRNRYTTSHPKDMTDDLIEVYRTSKKLMPLVHLPVQSGSDNILNLMNRKHTIAEYVETINRLKRLIAIYVFQVIL